MLMKIVQVVPRFPPAIGGMENHVYNVSMELVRRGHEVTVITSDDVDGSRRNVPTEIINGIKVFRSPLFLPRFFREYWIIPRILDTLKNSDADVAHIHGYRCLSSCLAEFHFSLKGIPTVLTPHGIFPPRNRLNAITKAIYDYWLGNWLLKFSNKIIALTENNRLLLLRIGCNEDKVAVIPNGVDLAKYETLPLVTRQQRKKFGFLGPTLLYVGRIDWKHRRGLEMMIKAMPLIAKEFVNTKFLIVGPDYGNCSMNLLELSKKLGVSDSIILTGPISDDQLLAYYSVSDTFILPSVYEGLSSSMLEAMASKVPVIALPTGGTRDVLTDGVNAVLLKEMSPKGISGAVSMILSNPKFREELCENAISIVREKYTWKTIVDQLEGVYNRVLATS